MGEKDANAILQKYGCKAICDAVNNAEEIPVTAVKKLSQVKAVNLDKQEHIRTGIYDVDRYIGGIYMGQVVVITGKRGEGKSTLASQIIANALDQSDLDGNPYSIFVYSGELPDYHSNAGWISKLQENKMLYVRSTNMVTKPMTFLMMWSIKSTAGMMIGRTYLITRL